MTLENHTNTEHLTDQKPDNSQNNQVPTQYIINTHKFIILSVLTFGLYHIWWIFKAWRFFLQKDQSDIMPAMRTIFAIFFLYPLFTEISAYAKEKNYSKDYPKPLFFIVYLILSLMVRLPDPYWILSILSFICLIPAFKALNYAKLKSSEFQTIERTEWSAKYIVTIVIGSIFWILVLFGLYLEMTEPQV